MARSLLLLFLLFSTSFQVRAQKVIQGTVRDAQTGETLPAANIQVEGTYQGTISNVEGVYEIRLETFPATLVVRYIGYKTTRLTVTEATLGRQDLTLAPVTYQLEELVVTDEDPAVNIMRKVIENKQAWRATLDRYRAEAYTRFTLENDTGIVSIIESLTESYWDREKGQREVVLARRKTSNLNIDEFLPAAQFVLNLYDDEVEVSGFHLIGVTHPDALRHYRFSLLETKQIDDQQIYVIGVTPRNKYKSAFVGQVSVLDEAYALLEVELRPGEAFLFPPPIQRYDVTYRQQFSNFGKAYWLPVDFRAEVDLKISFPGLLSFPTFKIRQFSRLSDYDVNTPLPDTLYASKDELQVDSVAVAADTLLDRKGTIIPLSVREVDAYESIDSTQTLAKAYKPTGALARFARVEEGDSESRGRSGAIGKGIDRLGLEPEVWFNRVDGAHLALRSTIRLSPRLSVTGVGGYKTGLEQWTYGGGGTVRIGRKRRADLEVFYRYGVDTRYTSVLRSQLTNSIDVLLAGTDFFDYFSNERVRVSAGYRIPAWYDTQVSVSYHDERHRSLAKTTDYDLLGEDEPQRTNPAVDTGRLRSVGLRVSVNDEEMPFGFSFTGQRRLVVTVEHSNPNGLASAFDFTRYQVMAEWRFNTLLRRRLLPNVLDVRLMATTFSGRLPVQRFGIVESAGSYVQPFGTLRTLQGRPYEGEQVLALFWEHNFRTLPFEMLGLRRLVRRGYNLILQGAHGRSWIGKERRAEMGFIPVVSDGFHHELGVGFSGLFSLLRIDATRRLDAKDFALGVSAARIF